MNDPNPPPLSQKLLEYADTYRKQARDLRQITVPPHPEADRLDALAAEMTTQAITLDTQNEANRGKAHYDKWLTDHRIVADWKSEQTKSLISMSQSAIRLLATINAGAAVALIAFLGNAIGKNAGIVADLFAGCLATFAVGIIVATLVSFGSYITQLLYGEESANSQKWARRLHKVTFAASVVGLGVFGGGCFQTYHAMRSMAKAGITGASLSDRSHTPADVAPPVKDTSEEGHAVTQTLDIPFKRNAPPPKKPPPEPPAPPPPPARQ